MYSFEIIFKPTTAHGNTDGLSRLPLPVTTEGQSRDSTIFNMTQIERLPVTAVQIRQATRKDVILSEVLEFT